MKKVISITQPLYEKDDIKINLKAIENDFLVNNYQNMLFQILVNILNNAKDALVDNQTNIKVIEIVLSQNDKEKVISILDNGGGISEDIIDRIFDPYFSTKKEQNGTGLGLYMSKVIIEERIQGRLSVENKGAGALFKIYLT
jgi:C4-dicarboxylate-specific signal transduction histidine kinase